VLGGGQALAGNDQQPAGFQPRLTDLAEQVFSQGLRQIEAGDLGAEDRR